MSIESKIVHNATEYAREHLAECVADVLAWQNTGLLPDGKFTIFRAMLAPVYGEDDREAEHIVNRLALGHAASQGWRALADAQPEPGGWVAVGWYLRGSGEWCTGTDIAPIRNPYTHWHPLPPPPVKP